MSFICPPWLSYILYNPVRKAFTGREKVLTESGVTTDSVVFEIGAGNGFFTEVLAKRAKKVYAVELQEAMIEKLRRRVQGDCDSVFIITGDIASLALGERFADVCLLYYSFHEVVDKIRAADNISFAVKTGGILSIYEPTIEVGKMQMEETVAIFEQRGFSKETERNRLFTRFVKLRKTLP
jgi:16S rRNA A1518/A1519 N6-dimethyltransferase RsmA/KsgA/DIM1 with predicted DNA glycosylase/AP lyase activity